MKQSIKTPAFQSNRVIAVSNSKKTKHRGCNSVSRRVRQLKSTRDETMQGIWIIGAIMHIPTPERSKHRKCDLLKR